MKNIAVIFGGRSSEHDISIITAMTPIIAALKAQPDKYSVLPVYISKDGNWYSEPELGDIKTYQREDFAEWLDEQTPVQLSLNNKLTINWPKKFGQRTTEVDAVFPAMHGTYGEDGSLMGLLRMANVPFVGCDIYASTVAMDKRLTKRVVAAAGLPVLPDVHIPKQSWSSHHKKLVDEIKQFELPVFVKPSHLGSSIGITKVESWDDLENGIEVALHYDTDAIVEPAVKNLVEVTVPVMGNDKPKTALVEQTLTGQFFDFEDKYLGQGKSGGKKGGGKAGDGVNSGYSKLPADLPQEMLDKCEQLALDTFRAISGSGLARVDMLINSDTDEIFINEVNPLPGSLYHHNWRAAGVSNIELINRLIELAEQHHAQQTKRNLVFDSSFLTQF